jgi:hypothetical protein
LECGGSQPNAFASVPNSGTQKKRAQVLFHGTRTDAQLPRDFLIAAALNQQIQHLLIPGCNFYSFEVHHGNSPPVYFCLWFFRLWSALSVKHILRQTFSATFSRS